MSRNLLVVTVTLISLGSLVSCTPRETIPETGRSRPTLNYSEEEMAVLGAELYEESLEGTSIITGTPDAEMVQRVGAKLAAVSGKDYDWEFRLVAAPLEKNAFCLPGGKVAVYSGILPIAGSEDGLAVVLGHEMAHATLQHGNERLSQPALKQLIGLPLKLGADLWGALAPRSRRLVAGVFGVGKVVGEFLPYDQDHEFEADEVGLSMMRRAGYDIRDAPRFWQRMMDAAPNRQKGDALSTHPEPEKRIERLNRLVALIEQ